MDNQNEKNYLIHFGNKNSGRYPRGSGENPHQHDGMRYNRWNRAKGMAKVKRDFATENPKGNRIQRMKAVNDYKKDFNEKAKSARMDSIIRRSELDDTGKLSKTQQKKLSDDIDKMIAEEEKEPLSKFEQKQLSKSYQDSEAFNQSYKKAKRSPKFNNACMIGGAIGAMIAMTVTSKYY